MAPNIPMGALILIEPVIPASITVGDVITFTLPDRLITHRVVAIARDDVGLQIVTKGDANDAADPVAIRAGAAIGAVRLSIPLAGYALAELQSWWRIVAAAILLGIGLDAIRRRVAHSRLAPAPA
jgi:signal peptidase